MFYLSVLTLHSEVKQSIQLVCSRHNQLSDSQARTLQMFLKCSMKKCSFLNENMGKQTKSTKK